MQWMLWVAPTAIFFGLIAVLLVGMTIWEIVQPSVERRGWLLPMTTTRGDRLFVGLLAGAYLNVIWLGWVPANQWWAVAATVLVVAVVMRWG